MGGRLEYELGEVRRLAALGEALAPGRSRSAPKDPEALAIYNRLTDAGVGFASAVDSAERIAVGAATDPDLVDVRAELRCSNSSCRTCGHDGSDGQQTRTTPVGGRSSP